MQSFTFLPQISFIIHKQTPKVDKTGKQDDESDNIGDEHSLKRVGIRESGLDRDFRVDDIGQVCFTVYIACQYILKSHGDDSYTGHSLHTLFVGGEK